MSGTKRIGVLLVMAIISWPAWADYQSEHELYVQALNAGDAVGAIRHCENAWRAAETELGDSATTAALALNYADLIMNFFPEKAIEPYERALAIAQDGIGPLDPGKLELLLTETRLGVDIENRKLARRLKKLLKNNSQLSSSPAVIRGWQTLARHDLHKLQFVSAKKSADKAVAAASTLDPPVLQLLATSLNLGGTVRTAYPGASKNDMIEAAALHDRAYTLFPPQPDINHFDPLLAQTMALRGVVFAIADSRGWYSLTNPAEGPGDSPAVSWQTEKPDYCSSEIKWAEKRKAPRHSIRALNEQFIGVALVGYDLGDEGVENAVLLADFKQAGFGKAAIETMSEWKLTEPPPQECRKNHLIRFQFAIDCTTELDTITIRQGGEYKHSTKCRKR